MGWWVYFWIIASALVLLGQVLRSVLENSLGQWPGPGPELENLFFTNLTLCYFLSFFFDHTVWDDNSNNIIKLIVDCEYEMTITLWDWHFWYKMRMSFDMRWQWHYETDSCLLIWNDNDIMRLTVVFWYEMTKKIWDLQLTINVRWLWHYETDNLLLIWNDNDIVRLTVDYWYKMTLMRLTVDCWYKMTFTLWDWELTIDICKMTVTLWQWQLIIDIRWQWHYETDSWLSI